jgi:RNA polymerase sigma factor (sigma-70 family)
MAETDQTQNASTEKGHWFQPTRWTIVLTAREGDTAQAKEALEQLCKTYWSPLHSYIRSRGHSREKAEDLTQAFFCHLLERNFLGAVDRKRGKFRSFLLASANYFLANERDFDHAQKRGGGQPLLSLDADEDEAVRVTEPADDLTPERIYEQEWARTLLRQALRKLRQEYAQNNKAEWFDRLKDFLEEKKSQTGYSAIAAELGMTPNTAAVTVYRMRQRLGELVRTEVAQTVGHPSEVDGEMRHILRVLSRP